MLMRTFCCFFFCPRRILKLHREISFRSETFTTLSLFIFGFHPSKHIFLKEIFCRCPLKSLFRKDVKKGIKLLCSFEFHSRQIFLLLWSDCCVNEAVKSLNWMSIVILMRKLSWNFQFKDENSYLDTLLTDPVQSSHLRGSSRFKFQVSFCF